MAGDGSGRDARRREERRRGLPGRSTSIAAVLGAALCTCSAPKGLWRDQWIFLGDEGDALVLVIQRQSSGEAEAKGWLAEEGSFRTEFYRRFVVAASDAPDLDAVIRDFSNLEDAPVRASVDAKDRGIEIGLRTRSASMKLSARSLDGLGKSTDPEGESVYRVGRASLESGRRRLGGWLLAEETPRDRPRRPFVHFGDFVFLVARLPGSRLLVLKDSRSRDGFDVAFVRSGRAVKRSTTVETELADGKLRVTVPPAGVRVDLGIRDRSRTTGVAPDGSGVVYEAMVLDGGGVAFAIRPAPAPR